MQKDPHYVKNKPSKAVKKFIKYLKKGDKVLEVGCNKGTDLIFLMESGFDVVGIDISKEVIKNVPNTQVANAEDLPFNNNSFDAVFSLNTLHFTDLNKSIPEIKRVLKKGGIAFISLITDSIKQDIKDILKKQNLKIIEEKMTERTDEAGTENEHIHKILFLVLKK